MQQLYSIEGDSETARLVRQTDWRATPLGPVERWPQSLRTSLNICLACRFPVLVWWGPQLVMLYNDEYVPVLGNKHPAAMGGIGREVWADVWNVVGPMLDSVLTTGKAAKADDLLLLMNRAGYVEETYFSFSYSPIVDESGGIGGIFTPVIETTEKVIGRRRVELLRELGSQPRADNLQDACASAARLLARAVEDLPFGIIYAIDQTSGAARLACSFGLDACRALVPDVIAPDDQAQPWLVMQAAATREVQEVRALDATAPDLPHGAWGAAVEQALAIPITIPGHEAATVVLVAAVSPHRALDDAYLSFYRLLADQLRIGISAALSYEAECKRALALAEIDRAKTTFFSNISHEFRTPLTLMLGPLEEVIGDSDVPASAREHLELIKRNGTRLLKLVNALLDFSRIEAGRMEASFEPLDLAAFTAELAGVFRSAVERAGLRLEVDCQPLSEPVYADRTMWEKIVLNLLSNAFKFTREGTITVRVYEHERHAVLTVSDTGVGIAEADLPRLFERFHRIEGRWSRSHEGSGIGLALVRDLVTLHGGQTRIESSEGHGTTVAALLPFGHAHLPADQLAREPSGGAPAPQGDAYAAEAELWLGSSRPSVPHDSLAAGGFVYIVDDNADMLDYVAKLLAPHHQVRTFSNGLLALEQARKCMPALIVSDVMMPVMGGYELLAAVKADKALAGVPVLLLSARAGEEERIEAARAGADDYLEKPFCGRELLAKVDALLLKSRIHKVESDQSERMHAILSQAPAAIALLRGPEHTFELANPLYQELMGRHDLLHKSVREALPELAEQGMFDLLDRAYASGKPYVGRALRADLVRGSAGLPQEAYFDCVYQPTFDSLGAVDGIAVVAFDVTETMRARRAAENASRAKDEFIAMLGHELRNPLAPIMTALEVMKLRGIDAVRNEHGIIERQAKHMIGLVNDLLDVARVSRGKVELRREPTELAAVVAAAVETASPVLEERRQILALDIPAQGLKLCVDVQRMSQVYANLLTNAAKYSDKGSRITVAGRRDGSDIVLDVTDTGRGISADMLPCVFDMFYQDPQSLSRSRGGLGLGLTIVRSLTELHGGSVSVDSRGPGKGATFTVRVPAADTAGLVPAADLGGASVTRQAEQHVGVLVVDDNVDAAEMLKELLLSFGYGVETAYDGPSGLRKLDEFWPDMAILDIGLPGMDGYELAERTRQLAGDRPVYLVALTGYGQEGDRERARSAGFDRHLTKPVNLPALLDMLAEVSSGKRAALARPQAH
ncbi:ATP-binding protein [Massilia horti]|uniref:histidine kinase n=1 Tax=Massilia horti TaxID=2562153 RepID=A0A4Y9TAM8_9BURK|nr:ATP-binding protein [Massilia horti]TFW35664.1 response regulator [Massilia horti]